MKPLPVIVCDSPSTTALAAQCLIESASKAGLKLAVTELVQERELEGLDESSRAGLRVESLEGVVMERALLLHRLHPDLAFTDAATLALAAKRSWLVLTQNPTLETIAAQLAVSCRSLHWLRVEMQQREPPPLAVPMRRPQRIREDHGHFSCFA